MYNINVANMHPKKNCDSTINVHCHYETNIRRVVSDAVRGTLIRHLYGSVNIGIYTSLFDKYFLAFNSQFVVLKPTRYYES